MVRKVACLLLFLVAFASGLPASAEPAKDLTLKTMPENYHLYAYDDCGAPARQPHVEMAGCYNASAFFIMNFVGVQQCSAVFGKEIRLTYDNLDRARSYILALSYTNKGAQRLEADGVELHGPLVISWKQSLQRVLVQVPQSVTQDGKMRLRLTNRDGLEATLLIAELWATGEPKKALRLAPVMGTPDGLSGHVMDMAYQGATGVTVRLVRHRMLAPRQVLATTTTQAGGAFTFPKTLIESLTPQKDLEVVASLGDLEVRKLIPVADQAYHPVRYHPLAAAVAGLQEHTLSLDGIWRINPAPDQTVREKPLDAAGWGDLKVPGQWANQGYDIPQKNTAALAREFTVPAAWAGYRIFLRFDAIHGGTHYWLNGKPLGYSENLFTPVEWEITDAARPGQTNRLDLSMVVDTRSEELSKSTYYTSYTLGGIDRAVRLFALPKLHLATLRVNAGLDRAYRDGELQLDLGLDNPTKKTQRGLEASIQLYDAAGKSVSHSTPKLSLEPLKPGRGTVTIQSHVPNPLKWNAEQPNLYKLVLELSKDGQPLERIERNIGFRTIEAKGRQIYVNGARIKLAGVCHHEIDPLTGRADTMRHAETDIKLYKSANLNCVRTSHYPATQEFLDAADRLGFYVDYEAPLCWVIGADDLADMKAILTPTSALIDTAYTHPSVIMYSLANESLWNPLFTLANKLCRQLDPTRLTTFNTATGVPKTPTDIYENCDVANQHYPQMPYEKVNEKDPRPFMVGETFFVVYHERTEVTINNPGLRELWAHGSAEPDSAYSKTVNTLYQQPYRLRPGIPPDCWNQIYHSDRCIGSEIWSGVDDIAFLPGGKVISCEHGNALWGIIDGWRRAKPEIWVGKAIFSPVWFLRRQVDYIPGQATIRIPMENRHSFTDFKDLTFAWALDGATGTVAASLPPAAQGELVIPIPPGTPAGKKMTLRVTSAKGELINAATITLGTPPPAALPQPRAGAPKFTDDGKTIFIQGNGFALVLNRKTGDFDATNPRHTAPLLHFPAIHTTRYDIGDLAWGKVLPYAQLPEAKTRVVEAVTVTKKAAGIEITIKDRYQDFAGSVRWLLDKNGVGKLSYDYAYTGKLPLETRESGLKTLLRPQFDEVRWRRWSEWGDVFPAESISRTTGRAKARRDSSMPDVPANVRPEWPWSQDQNELGTADFRAAKFNIYDAVLVAPDGSGVGVSANADVHFRPCLAEDGVKMHLLTQCPLAPVVLKKGARLKGEFALRLLSIAPSK